MTGEFAGLIKPKEEYQIIINSTDSYQIRIIPISSITKLKMKNGTYLNPFPKPCQINLVYEIDGTLYNAPLTILNHLNKWNKNSKYGLFALGAVADIVMIVAMSSMEVSFD